eukprot:391438-Pyramimonas_sp.AAC.1
MAGEVAESARRLAADGGMLCLPHALIAAHQVGRMPRAIFEPGGAGGEEGNEGAAAEEGGGGRRHEGGRRR